MRPEKTHAPEAVFMAPENVSRPTLISVIEKLLVEPSLQDEVPSITPMLPAGEYEPT